MPSFHEIIVVRPNGQWTTADVKTDVVGDVYGSLSSPPQHLFVVPHWSFLYFNVQKEKTSPLKYDSIQSKYHTLVRVNPWITLSVNHTSVQMRGKTQQNFWTKSGHSGHSGTKATSAFPSSTTIRVAHINVYTRHPIVLRKCTEFVFERVFKLRGNSISTWTRWGGEGVKNVCFCPRSGYNKNCPPRGGRVKKWQIYVHVVVECPLMSYQILKLLK